MRYIDTRHGTLDLLYLLVSDVRRRPHCAPASGHDISSPDVNLDLPGPCRRWSRSTMTLGSCHDVSSQDLNLDLPGPCWGNTPRPERVLSIYWYVMTGMYQYIPLP
jgi:hypothetical protein